jgi:hypothetical protein
MKVEVCPAQQVKVANGQTTIIRHKAKFSLRWGQDYLQHCEALITDLPGFDLVLGLPWLRKNEVVPDYKTLGWNFKYHHKEIKILPQNHPEGKQQTLFILDAEGRSSESIRMEAIARKLVPNCFKESISTNIKRKWSHVIDTGDAKPVKVHGRPYTPPEHLLIDKFIKEGLEEGIIRPSNSPWSAPIILVKKANGETRVCVDFRSLNALTRKNSYPLPRIDEAYQFLKGAIWFTCIDLKSGFWQVSMDPSSIEKTAFGTKKGSYEFLVMPSGLCNAPATFQSMMNDILRPVLDKCALVYLDDVVIYSSSFEQHIKDVTKVLQLLDGANLVLSPKK